MTFPLATLAAKITASGITAPSYSDILNSLIASMQSIFGSDIYLGPDSQEYQQLAVIALAISDENQTAIAAYIGFSPSFAQGVNLSSLVKINGLARQIPTNSTVTVSLVGVAGTVISQGVVRDANSQLWNLPNIVIIPGGGSIDVTATAQTAGALAAAAHTVNKIQTVTLGWQSVDNANPAVTGAPVETDAALRARQTISTGLPAQTPLQAITAAVANVLGVQRYAVYENPTNSTDSNGIPAHSISVVVLGGDATAIATVIEQKKSPGTGTFGSTTITVNDPAGVPVAINFYQLALDSIYVTLTIKALTNFVSSTTAIITSAVVSFINALPIGNKVYYNWVLAQAQLMNNPLGLTFDITSMTIGTAPSPVGLVDIAIPFNHAANTVAANIVINVT